MEGDVINFTIERKDLILFCMKCCKILLFSSLQAAIFHVYYNNYGKKFSSMGKVKRYILFLSLSFSIVILILGLI